MIKNYDTQNDWMIYHKNGGSGGDMSNSQGLNLNNDDGTFASGSNTFITGKSATTFTVGSSSIVQNGSDDYCAFTSGTMSPVYRNLDTMKGMVLLMGST